MTWSTGSGSRSTSWTSRARPSCPPENLASLALTSTRPLRRSPGSTWPCSRSRVRSGLAGSASSDSREVSSDCSNFKRREREGGCVGVGDGVREGGYLYRDRSRVPMANGKWHARSGRSYRRLRSARRNRLLASAASTRLLSSMPSTACSATLRDRDGSPSSSLESLFYLGFIQTSCSRSDQKLTSSRTG